MKPFRNPIALTSFLFVCLLSSCYTESYFMKRAEMDTSKIPADFNPKKHILLVAEMPRLNKPEQRNKVVTRKLDEALKEKYPYKYEIVSPQEIYTNQAKYGDTSVYKYALINSLSSVAHGHTMTVTTRSQVHGTSSSSVNPSARTTYIDFHFYDRTAKLNYPPTGNSSSRLNYTVTALVQLINKAKNKG